MTESPLVTVVTPCLDPGDRLIRCIESVREQSYPHIEHVIIDGGSSDGTLDLLARTDGIDWISERDEGQAHAINKGFARARGDILGWLNADDSFFPSTVGLVVDAFQRDADVGWVIGDVEIAQGEDREVRRPAQIDRPITWAARNLAGQPGSFVARWALDQIGMLDESFHYMFDCDLFLRLVDAGIEHHYIPHTLALFEIHSSSKSGSVSHAEFAWEEGVARLKSGRIRTAAIAFGRAAAWRASDSGRAIDAEVAAASQWLSERGHAVPMRLLKAGAETENALLAVKERGLTATPALLNPRIWRYPETRSRLKHAGGRQIRRMKRSGSR